ncbi:uncharacterized protein LOC121413792 [Lytechinus variegatus]|uniref:uncharacterized protein LOC121413792 n=1 Tax=Lytechinus variegatus TaxID=7654 RepID=UPI001BB0FF5D|nr:uncharacterized protein LOC121413792 [Lytechinus variegatus]
MRNILIFMTVILASCYQARAVSYVEGQEAELIFPYPCESTEITLQQSNRLPFYNSADGSTLSLHEDQHHRFSIHYEYDINDCYLKLTIINVKRVDQGTYILFVYGNQRQIIGDPYRIWLNIDYPPGKASCVVGEYKGGKWVSIDCTAKTGSLPGKIECYQDGEWMPPLTGPIETHITLKQTILIRKSQPAFCCSSFLNGNKSRDECDDTGLFLEGTRSNDLSATISMQTTTGSQNTEEIIKICDCRQYHFSTNTFSTDGLKESKDDLKTILIYCSFAAAVVLIFIMKVCSSAK